VAVISALEISILGTVVVFLTLVALAVLVWLIGRLIRVTVPSASMAMEKPGKEQPLASVDSNQQQDLVIIAAVMKQLGVEGELKITQIK